MHLNLVFLADFVQCTCNQCQTLIWYKQLKRGQEYKISQSWKRESTNKSRTPCPGDAGTKVEAEVALCHPGSEHSERPKPELSQNCCNSLLAILAVKNDHDINISQKRIFAWKFPSCNTAYALFLTS